MFKVRIIFLKTAKSNQVSCYISNSARGLTTTHKAFAAKFESREAAEAGCETFLGSRLLNNVRVTFEVIPC